MESDAAPRKPVPVPDSRSEGFWAAAVRHVLAIQQCAACGAHAYPPVDLCRHCLSSARSFRFEPASGRGRVKTWTVMRQAFLPGFAPDVPYIVAEVVLDDPDGVRMIGQIIGAAPDALSLGTPVHVVFDDVAPGVAVPQFALADSSRQGEST